MDYSYFNEAEDGLQPETEYIYELELPTDFVPTPEDGEVSIFYLWDLDQVCSLLSNSEVCIAQIYVDGLCF